MGEGGDFRRDYFVAILCKHSAHLVKKVERITSWINLNAMGCISSNSRESSNAKNLYFREPDLYLTVRLFVRLSTHLFTVKKNTSITSYLWYSCIGSCT